jgi:thioredoxin 1
MASDLIKHVTDATFETEVLGSKSPVLVDFWAKWCGPCIGMAPALDELAEAYGDKLQIVKLDVDENQMISGKFGIRAMPTLMFFKDGQVTSTVVGAKTKSQLATFIDQQMA